MPCDECKKETDVGKCDYCEKDFCYEHLPNNAGGWNGGHTCNNLAPKCQVNSSIFWSCGGKIKKCPRCEYYFCYSHRKPGYQKGHACDIGCDTTYGYNCVGTRKDVIECPTCKNDENVPYKYCGYHILPVSSLLAFKAPDGDDGDKTGGHVCNGVTRGSLAFGDKVGDFADILFKGSALILTGNPEPLAKKFAANSLKVILHELTVKFKITPEDLQTIVTNTKALLTSDSVKLQVGLAGLQEQANVLKTFFDGAKFSLDELMGELTDGKKTPEMMLRSIQEVVKCVSSLLEKLCQSIPNLAEAQLESILDIMVNMAAAFLNSKELQNIKTVIMKLDEGLELEGKLGNMVPSLENIPRDLALAIAAGSAESIPNLALDRVLGGSAAIPPVEAKIEEMTKFLTESPQLSEALTAKLDRVKFGITTVTDYVKSFLELVDKAARMMEICDLLSKLIIDVTNLLKQPLETLNSKAIIDLIQRSTDLTAELLALCGMAVNPERENFGGTCWLLDDSEEDPSAKLKSIDIVDPVSGSVVDEKREALLMELLKERKQRMVALERTVLSMQREIERLTAAQEEEEPVSTTPTARENRRPVSTTSTARENRRPVSTTPTARGNRRPISTTPTARENRRIWV